MSVYIPSSGSSSITLSQLTTATNACVKKSALTTTGAANGVLQATSNGAVCIGGSPNTFAPLNVRGNASSIVITPTVTYAETSINFSAQTDGSQTHLGDAWIMGNASWGVGTNNFSIGGSNVGGYAIGINNGGGAGYSTTMNGPLTLNGNLTMQANKLLALSGTSSITSGSGGIFSNGPLVGAPWVTFTSGTSAGQYSFGGATAGTGATAFVRGNSLGGTITVTAGSGASSGGIISIYLPNPYPNYTTATVTPASTNTSSLVMSVGINGTVGFMIYVYSALTNGVSYYWNYTASGC